MTRAYDPALIETAHNAAKRLGITLREGVYAWMTGPSYETPAEIRMARTLGADAVGMSTVPEVIAARHMGARVLGISCITNMAAGVTGQPLSHAEVTEVGRRAAANFLRLICGVIEGVTEGDAFFFFQKKRKNQKKKVFRLRPFLRRVCWVRAFFRGLFLGDVLFTSFRRWYCFRASGVLFLGRSAHLATIIFCVSGFREWGYLQSSFSPAPCSPLRRLRAYSAELVRAPTIY